jgi:hypothetical protein
MTDSVEIDRAFGLQSETDQHKQLEALVGCGLTKDTYRFAPFDFYNDGKTIYVELKTRRFKYDKYPTTLVPMSKIRACDKNPTRTYYFAFAFEDGIYYTQYDKGRFDLYKRTDFKRNDRAESVPHLLIPITDLLRHQDALPSQI